MKFDNNKNLFELTLFVFLVFADFLFMPLPPA